MKYPTYTYAQALLEAMNSASVTEKNKVIKRFVQVVAKNGDASRLSQIYKEVQKRFVQREGGRMIDIDLARPAPRSVTDGILKQFTKKDFIRFSIQPSLIAGVRVTINGEQELDNSFARRLKKIFIS